MFFHFVQSVSLGKLLHDFIVLLISVSRQSEDRRFMSSEVNSPVAHDTTIRLHHSYILCHFAI